MAKILVAEDDEAVRLFISDTLEMDKHAVECVESGSEAASRLKHYHYDAMVLDWNLPEMTGIEVLKAYRQAGGRTPALMLTGNKAIGEKQIGFEAGADDYLTKPFDTRELSMRVKALLRRPDTYATPVLNYQGISLDESKHFVSCDGTTIHLSPSEFQVLHLLLTNPGKVFSGEQIIKRLWPNDTDASPDSVRIYVARVRKKLSPHGKDSCIHTVHGVGYKAE